MSACDFVEERLRQHGAGLAASMGAKSAISAVEYVTQMRQLGVSPLWLQAIHERRRGSNKFGQDLLLALIHRGILPSVSWIVEAPLVIVKYCGMDFKYVVAYLDEFLLFPELALTLREVMENFKNDLELSLYVKQMSIGVATSSNAS